MSISSVFSLIENVISNQNPVPDVLRRIEDFYHSSFSIKSLECDCEEIFKDPSEMFSESDRFEIVNHILLNSNQNDVGRLLEIVRYKFPDYELSPFQQVLLDIFNDTENCSLSYAAICEKLHNRGCFSQENLDVCIDRAFILKNHNIVIPSNGEVNVHDYVLNFLWINLDCQDREKNVAQSVFGLGINKEHETEFLGKVEVWANDHPGAKINLWIDTALVTENAVKQTFLRLREMSSSSGVDLSLCDIRSLGKVRENMNRYFHPSIPVYFRVDLAKVLIADELMLHPDTFKYVVVSDIDIGSQPTQILFDTRTIGFLKEYGYVFNGCGVSDFENSFFIFETGREDLRLAHQHSLIDILEIKMRRVESHSLEAYFHNEYIFDSQFVYNGYREFRRPIEESALGMNRFSTPRKLIKTPLSQFDFGGVFRDNKRDHKNEIFRFWGSDVPYVKRGRAMCDTNSPYQYVRLSKYERWKPEPISLEGVDL